MLPPYNLSFNDDLTPMLNDVEIDYYVYDQFICYELADRKLTQLRQKLQNMEPNERGKYFKSYTISLSARNRLEGLCRIFLKNIYLKKFKDLLEK